ncbi:Por secretion system C-terminal sorting domain-containing protein [Chitinophaga sp. YR627]|uniref:T9SS type A sorting domain-containing protein n=1 Tax=Chitinophaga sp. YR627 TaxID=1881041 RepID=UPI0008E41481|nr:T9SS type A sorting domain-containing protein [Chitinophaga sp. YR627]SFM90265.1 Por secretion system C-terminal sorting domain-containing protein [Chitinophaga sp. YR627]
MKAFSATLLLLVVILHASAQNVSPGGVKAPRYWYLTTNTKRPVLKSVFSADSIAGSLTDTGSLNFRPAAGFSGVTPVRFALPGSNLHKASYFTVYKATNAPKESLIWHTSNDDSTRLVLTTSRTADLSDKRYLNYTDLHPDRPKVNAYLHQKTADSSAVQKMELHIGCKKEDSTLPVITFKGLLPELLIYDRVLSNEELLRVSSYLCLKYGVTLSEPEATYLNSAAREIWDGTQHSEFHNNMAGIIRDDSSGLSQKKACTSNAPGSFIVSTKDSLPDLSALLWGDNDLALIPDEKRPGQPVHLQRQLLFNLSGTDSMQIAIALDTKKADIAYPLKPVYWLAIDRTGKENFQEFVKMDRLDEQQIAHFNKLVIRKENTGTTRLGLIAGNDILLAATITEPLCADPASGKVRVKVHGAIYPYHVSVKSDKYQQEITAASEDGINFYGVHAGNYVVTVTDAMQHVVTDSFYVNNEDGPKPAELQSKYLLNEGASLTLNASERMVDGISYQWKGPQGFANAGASVTLTKAGPYSLITSKNGCEYVKQFVVSHPPKNAFRNVLIYPNPSTTGSFEVSVSLDKVSPVRMSIFAEDGRHITTRELDGFANYRFSSYVPYSGLYYVNFSAGLSVTTRKIIVLK